MTEGDLRLNARLSAIEWLLNRIINERDIGEELSTAIAKELPEGSVAEMTRRHIRRISEGHFDFPDYRPDEP